MVEITLSLHTPEGTRQILFAGKQLTIGRSDAASLVINDNGLSRLHASINREGDQVWIVDEASTNGSYVNGHLVPPDGVPLEDGDEIAIGDHTTITVSITKRMVNVAAGQPKAAHPSQSLFVVLPIAGVVVLLGVAALVALRPSDDDIGPSETGVRNTAGIVNRPPPSPPASVANQSTPITPPSVPSPSPIESTKPADEETNKPPLVSKLYKQMTEEERLGFVERQAQRIAWMMGNRPYAFTLEALVIIKDYVDQFARRENRCSGPEVRNDCSDVDEAALSKKCLWGEDLRTLYRRARCYAPLIIRSFKARDVPAVVGLYLPVIETEYHRCLTSDKGAGGLFQLMPYNAEYCDMQPAEICDVEKSTPCAAEYMRSRILEFGTDPMSVALGIAGYNRSPESVKRDLRNVLAIKDNEEAKERSFWTLVANKGKLDAPFQNENIKYVPKFFAAAIIGENPQAFGLEMNPLSTYTIPINEFGKKAARQP